MRVYTTVDSPGYSPRGRCIDGRTMARSKKSLKNRPKFKQARRKKDRKMKARKAAWHKRGLARNKKRRQNRGKRR